MVKTTTLLFYTSLNVFILSLLIKLPREVSFYYVILQMQKQSGGGYKTFQGHVEAGCPSGFS